MKTLNHVEMQSKNYLAESRTLFFFLLFSLFHKIQKICTEVSHKTEGGTI